MNLEKISRCRVCLSICWFVCLSVNLFPSCLSTRMTSPQIHSKNLRRDDPHLFRGHILESCLHVHMSADPYRRVKIALIFSLLFLISLIKANKLCKSRNPFCNVYLYKMLCVVWKVIILARC